MLRTYLFDAYTARKGGRDSTGNGDARLLPDAALGRHDQSAGRARQRDHGGADRGRPATAST